MEYNVREVNMDDGMNDCMNELDLIKTEDIFEEDYGGADLQCYSDNISTDTADYESQSISNNCIEMNREKNDLHLSSAIKRKISEISTNNSREVINSREYSIQQHHQSTIFPHTGEEQQEDLQLLSLLTKWKLERLYKHFLEQGISLYILKIIKNHHIEKLCKNLNVGTQAYFEHCLENFRNSNIPLTVTCQPEPSPIVLPQQKTFTSPAEVGVASILSSSKYGLMLLRFYDEHKELREEDRHRLIGLIAQYYDQNDIHLSLPLSYKIEQDIIDIFPTEKIEFYRTSKRGRIYNKYCNLKSSNKNLKLSTNSEIKIQHETETITLCPEKNAEVTISYLKHSQLSTDQFENYWKDCSNYRISDIKESCSLIEVFKKWPEYKCIPKGYRLIDMDFSILYPTKPNIVQKWQEMEDALFTILDNERTIRKKSVRAALSNINKTSKNGKAATLMWATHAFLVPWQREVTTDSTGKKICTRFTISDSQNSFLVLCANEMEMENHIKCKSILSAPIILTISNDISTINEVYVLFANSKYPFEDFIEAVDMCFKIFHIFNIDYPKASANFWNFIQNFFYEIKSKDQFAKVSILMMEIIKKRIQVPCSNSL